jgi:hypothetical protein
MNTSAHGQPSRTSANLETMNTSEHEAILTVCLLAAFADGGKNDAERAEFKRITDGLPSKGRLQPGAPPGQPHSKPRHFYPVKSKHS